MCMIALRPVGEAGRGSNMPNSVIDTAMSRHPDGFGMAWREDGVLRIAKYGPSGRKAFRKELKRLDRRADIEYTAHFRWATHGPKDAEMAHPYTYEDPEEGTVAVIHNGVIDIKTTPKESDTYAFVNQVLARLPSRWWANPALVFLVNQSIGWSRLVIMTARETVNLQEEDGEWDGGIWYSSNHRPAKQYASSSDANTTGSWDKETASWKPSSWAGLDDVQKRNTTGVYGYWDAEGKYHTYPTKPATSEKGQTDDTPAKSAEDSAKVLLPAVAESSPLVITHTAFPVAAAKCGDDGWRKLVSAGHLVTAVVDVDWDNDGDYPDGVICDECYTSGDLYIIDGSYHIDMGHQWASAGASVTPADDDHEEERELERLNADDTEDLLCEDDEERERAGLLPTDGVLSRRARRRAARRARVLVH